MIKEAIEKLMQAENLTYDQVKESVDEIMTGQASPALIASFLTALSIKGETDEEIAGAAESMRSKALPLDSDGDILDIVGTRRRQIRQLQHLHHRRHYCRSRRGTHC